MRIRNTILFSCRQESRFIKEMKKSLWSLIWEFPFPYIKGQNVNQKSSSVVTIA